MSRQCFRAILQTNLLSVLFGGASCNNQWNYPVQLWLYVQICESSPLFRMCVYSL